MSWILVVAWVAAVVLAAVMLGFGAYEIIWKARRLQGDLRQLQLLGQGLSRLKGETAAAQQRLARGGVRGVAP